jgi:NAD(P)-dependent dehydrogenase (short-subunit alcohol dehydrogenase family)
VTGKVGLVIGGNRGIGYALVCALARYWGSTGKIYLTARREHDAVQATSEIERATGVKVGWFVFDLSNPADPERIASALRSIHDGVDVVVQNGAYLPRAGRDAIDDARPMIEANSHGTLRVLEAFVPLLRENGRIVVVASGMGILKNLPDNLRPLFNTKSHSPQEINAAIDGYVDAVESGNASEVGWPDWVNIPSKVAQVALTRASAREARELGRLPRGAAIVAACPGVTLTDATRDFMGTVFKEEDAQTPEEAAQGLIRLLIPNRKTEQLHGELVQHGVVIPFGD